MARKKPLLQIPEVYTVTKWGGVINERPKKMNFEEYRELRREQTKRLKARLRGFMVWKSKSVVVMNRDGSTKAPGETWGTATRDRIPVLRFVD